jgi:hypothetical protein
MVRLPLSPVERLAFTRRRETAPDLLRSVGLTPDEEFRTFQYSSAARPISSCQLRCPPLPRPAHQPPPGLSAGGDTASASMVM